MTDTSVKVGTAIIWAIVIFIVSAIIEGLISVFLFKRLGKCPYVASISKKA